MPRSPFRSIFLPAIVASGAVFATVTLPLSVMNAAPKWLSPWSTPTAVITSPEKSARPIIRYVGLSIVLSVGAGISVAEAMRRLTAHRRLAQPSTPFSGHPDVNQTNAVDKDDSPSLSAKTTEADVTYALQPTVDFGQLIQATSAATSPELGWDQTSREDDDVDKTTILAPLKSQSHSRLAPDFTDEAWVILPAETIQQWLHLQVPTQVLESNLSSKSWPQSTPAPSRIRPTKIMFGLCHDNRYYGLIRHTTDRATLSCWVKQFSDQDKTVVITQHGQQYRIWQAVPEAIPAQSSSSSADVSVAKAETNTRTIASPSGTSLLAS